MLLLALAGYILPWVTHPGSSLTLGALDLAEWTSLHPEERFFSPALQTPLLLRLPLLFITIMLSFARPRWFSAVGCLLLVMTALPPLDFFVEARGDANYRQQFVLAVAAIAGAGLGLSGWLARWRAWIVALSGIAAAVTGILGLLQARDYLIGFSMPVALGWGVAVMVIGVLGYAVMTVIGITGQRPQPE
ncbi:MAG: hypothetical protein OHK0046_51320 [Anaerolineae bacterium]